MLCVCIYCDPMNMLKEIQEDLEKNVDIKYRDNLHRFFGHKIKARGVRIPIVRKIADKYFNDVKTLERHDFYNKCEKLLKTRNIEETFIAFQWSYKRKNNMIENDFIIFEKWIKKYVDNWAKCDDFCTNTMGYFILKYPKYIKNLKKWAKHKNMWIRRASAVSLIYPVRKDKGFLKHIFKISEILLEDKEDLVQKAYGWALKVGADQDQKQVFEYVMKNKHKMPRTALRYAIEKMPKTLKQKAMQ